MRLDRTIPEKWEFPLDVSYPLFATFWGEKSAANVYSF
jgi:hypothetical protein